jgi:hypothetical protein
MLATAPSSSLRMKFASSKFRALEHPSQICKIKREKIIYFASTSILSHIF